MKKREDNVAVEFMASNVYTELMARGILIAGNDSALVNAIEAETAKRAGLYTIALIPNRAGARLPLAVPGRTPLDWNPGSPISARTVVLAAENRLGRIDEAILVCDPPAVSRPIADLGFADVELTINDQIKGWFFLAKELATAFKAQGEGTLVLVYPEINGKNEGGILGQAALAVFHSLTRSLLSAVGSEPYLTFGFTTGETGDEAGFAAFIAKQLEDGNRRNNGKLHKYGKLGIFR